MARAPLHMRQINEILRLRHQGQLSVRDIARSCGLPASTVGDYLKRAEAVNLGWPLPEGRYQGRCYSRGATKICFASSCQSAQRSPSFELFVG